MRYLGMCRVVSVIAILLAMPLSTFVYAENDKPVAQKQVPEQRAVSSGKIRGLERATVRADGKIVVHGRLSGKGYIDAEHVVIEGELSPGDSPGCINFGGNVTFNASSSLLIEIGGTVPCTEYDQINVANTLTINGAAFELVLLSPYVPQFGDSYDVMSWGTLSGSGFGSIDTSAAVLPYPLHWDMSLLLLTGEISVGVINIADADLAPWNNPDGNINAADLMIAIQLALEQRVPGALQYAHGDINNDGVINVVDVILIKQLVLQN